MIEPKGWPMVTLFEIAFSSFMYSKFTDFEDTYLTFRASTGGTLDLAKKDHRDFLLEWLNKWGCRFDTGKLPKVSEVVRQWHVWYEKELPSNKRHLWQLSGEEIGILADAYEDLRDRTAFTYKRGGKTINRRIGATAASKILFACRPRAAIAWDELMRKKMKVGSARLSYVEFLESAKKELLDLKKQCHENGIKLTALPAELGRQKATPAQLLGEYYWAKYTRGLETPDPRTLKHWVKWSQT